MQRQQEALKHVESQLESARKEAQRPFPQEAELKENQSRLDQLNIELNMAKKACGPKGKLVGFTTLTPADVENILRLCL